MVTPSSPAVDPAGISTDPVTGVMNRSALAELLNEALASKSRVSLLVLDLDEFAVVNQSLGHDFGDKLLATAAKRLRSVFDDRIFRLHGDEFAALLPTAKPSQLNEIADTILAKWKTPLVVEGVDIYSGVSIGLVSRAEEHASADDMLRDAEIAVQEAKRRGRNQTATFTSDLRDAAEEELNTQMLGRRAAANREFHLFWQPMYDTQTGRITACEALMRWRPAGGANTLPAADFIPFLERSGLITPVGQHVIEQAFNQYGIWSGRADIEGAVPISMNVSKRQLESGAVVDSILSALNSTGVPGEGLIVEIPESVLKPNDVPMIKDLQRLREEGVRIALDDFGAGQSSLLAITELPIDIVKIDRTAASRIVPDEEAPVLTAIQDILNKAELMSVVGGVENQGQLNWLMQRGWECVQGYYLAKPSPADDITAKLAAETKSGLRAAA